MKVPDLSASFISDTEFIASRPVSPVPFSFRIILKRSFVSCGRIIFCPSNLCSHPINSRILFSSSSLRCSPFRSRVQILLSWERRHQTSGCSPFCVESGRRFPGSEQHSPDGAALVYDVYGSNGVPVLTGGRRCRDCG